MDVYSFKTKLLYLLNNSIHPFNVESNERADSILLSCSDYSKFSLQIHESRYQKSWSNRKNKEADPNSIIESLKSIQKDNPILFDIFVTLFELYDANVISERTFTIIMERVSDHQKTLKADLKNNKDK